MSKAYLEHLWRDAEFDLELAVSEIHGIAAAERDQWLARHKSAIDANPLAFTGLTAPVKPTLKLADYVDADKAERDIPVALAPQPLPAGFQWGMLGNDTIGDCVIAMMLHSVEEFFLSLGLTPPPFSVQDAFFIYSAITGWNPADPSTDNGTDEGQAMAYWQNTGLKCSADGSVHKIAASVAVDPANRNMRHLAMCEFDAVQYAIQLPVTWQGQSSWTGVPSDDNPDSQPGSWGGHGVFGRDYDATGKEGIGTWGSELIADGDSLDAYLVQASIVLSEEQVNTKTGVSRFGLHWDDLVSDVKKLPANPVQAHLA